jgi:hypothetical protein
LSLAAADKETVPDNVAPSNGLVSDTVGGTLSGTDTVKVIVAASDPSISE